MPILSVNPKQPSLVDRLCRRLQFALLPPHCLLCGARSGTPRDLCPACAADLSANRSACACCALPLATPAALCGECLQREPPFDAAYAPFLYSHPLDLLMTQLKFGRSLAAGRVLSELWITALRAALAQGTIADIPDAVVPVPLHATRLRERGYNQTLELAKPLARALRIALAPGLLRRTRATAAQANLDAVARRRNLRGAFEVDAKALAAAGAPARVVLLDDVMTTGATLRECARTLKRAGVARVEVWALARAPHRR
ncbi:MAG: ComF family protein [Rudaea sp.]|uniref:ComF family protein n=1 Tax=unclassified Rudaea TaxID=2627037 RepID=UPI0010F64EE5|nr:MULTISPECIES: ComF family protein [unclassified Rudaea]MBN8885416.1 ComF family protein [Rudaea sp.]